MYIEALSFGQVVGACEIPDEWINDPDLPYLTDEINHRKEAVDIESEVFRRKVEQFYKPWDRVEFRLVFQSKMRKG